MLKAFGHQKWFKTYVMQMQNIADERFIKGRRIPVSGVWWTKDSKPENTHTDWNTFGPTFALTAEEYEGGDLFVGTPNDHGRKIRMTRGKIVAGRWSERSHGNTKAEAKRRSFIICTDFRALCENYKCVGQDTNVDLSSLQPSGGACNI